MGNQVKRPLGLNKAKKNKKTRAEDDVDVKDGTPETEKPQIELDAEPDDELGQLVALYDAFLLGENEQSGQKLLSGIVHECDRQLREAAEGENKDGNKEKDEGNDNDNDNDKKTTEAKDITEFPPQFHDVYSRALIGLAQYADIENEKEGPEQFASAAVDRVNVGLGVDPDNSELLFTNAKALITWADMQMKGASHRGQDMYDAAVSVLDRINEAIAQYERAEKNVKKYNLDQALTVATLLELGDGFSALEQAYKKGKLAGLCDRYTEWCRKRYEQILATIPEPKSNGKSVENGTQDELMVRKANRGLGDYYLSLATQKLPDDEDDEEEEEEEGGENGDPDAAKDLLQKALGYLLKAEYDEDDEGSIYPVIAEAQIELANLLEDDDAQQADLYKQAAIRLKKAQRLGLGDYSEQIDELIAEE